MWNVTQNLLAGYSKILVTCTDDRALSIVTNKLDAAGLLTSEKVELVLRGEY